MMTALMMGGELSIVTELLFESLAPSESVAVTVHWMLSPGPAVEGVRTSVLLLLRPFPLLKLVHW